MFVFLLSSERSGSNFITKVMNAHKRIVGPSTKHIFNPILRNYFRYGDLQNPSNWEELLKDILRLLNANFSIWESKFNIEELNQMAPPGELTSLLKAIYSKEAAIHKKDIVFVKENHVYEYFPYLLLNFPQAKYIYLVRDPRDMALSWKSNENAFGGVVRAAKQWKKDQQNSLKNVAILNETKNAYLIRYEDLLENTQKSLNEICSFLGIEFDEQMLSFHEDKLTKKNAAMNSAWSNLSRKVITNNYNKYRKALSEIEIKMVEKICYYELKHLGYSLEYSENELNEISESEVANFELKENSTLNYSPVEGVLENMSIKASIYRRYVSN